MVACGCYSLQLEAEFTCMGGEEKQWSEWESTKCKLGGLAPYFPEPSNLSITISLLKYEPDGSII